MLMMMNRPPVMMLILMMMDDGDADDDEQTTSDDAMLSENSYDQRPQLYRSVGRCKKRGSFVFVRSTSRALITG